MPDILSNVTGNWLWLLIGSLAGLAIGASLKAGVSAFVLYRAKNDIVNLTAQIEAINKKNDQERSDIQKRHDEEIANLTAKLRHSKAPRMSIESMARSLNG